MPQTLVKLIRFLGPDYPIVYGFWILGQTAQGIPLICLLASIAGFSFTAVILFSRLKTAQIDILNLHLTDQASVPLLFLSYIAYFIIMLALSDGIFESLARLIQSH